MLKGSAKHSHDDKRPSEYSGYSAMASVTQTKLGGATSQEYGE